MKEFKLSGVVTISIHTTIKAKTLEEAIVEGERRGIEMLHSFNSKSQEEQEKSVWTVEEFDGVPYNIKER